ncbi:MAG: DUF1285 domain-containing protein [Endozoicomonas sp. (ex Botrylloides leachii)]|nr:DUF1285 domain-containing protein [Endozoicomonas sp. (ex Botrylloides leachii)]
MKNKKGFPAYLAESIQMHGSLKKAPPVHLWNPPFCGDIDIKILRDGQWLYMGSPITRPALVKLFASVLRKDNDGCYYLITPAEKVRIQVEDAPFIMISVEQKLGYFLFTTNIDDKVILNKQHPLMITINPKTGEPSPYIRVKEKLDALVHRNVFYQLIEYAEERVINGKKCLGIISFDEFYLLGQT